MAANLHTLMLAPMAELSHRALRELIFKFITSTIPNSAGSASQMDIVYFTEMISAPGLLAGGPLEKWYLDNGPCPQQLVYQLVGAEPDHLVKAAALLDRQECLGININMGCCAPAITRTGAGVRWMEDSGKAARLIERIRRITKKQLGVKIRLGPKTGRNGDFFTKIPDNGDQPGSEPETEPLRDLPFLLRYCRTLEDAGLDIIILHPRTAAEKLKRRAQWGYVETLRKELKIPIAGNGDINSIEELASKAGEGKVMAGRLLVREPWAFAAVLAFSEGRPKNSLKFNQKINIEETGLHFLELLTRHQPPEFHLSRARRFFRYYCDNVTWAEHLRNKINREENLAGIGQAWRAYFAGGDCD